MTAELSVEEKIGIIDSHIRNLAYNKYNLEMTILAENAKDEPSQESLDRINKNLSENSNQIKILEEEKASLI